jgi:hypothetical protein
MTDDTSIDEQEHPPMSDASTNKRLLAMEKKLKGLKISHLLLISFILVCQCFDLAPHFSNDDIAKFDVVTAREFILADDQRNPRSTLSINEKGTASLTFYSKDGQSRAAFMVDQNGTPSLGLTGSEGNVQSLFTVDEKGPKWSFYDKSGKERLSLVAGDNGFPGLYIYDKKGRNRMRMLVASTDENSYSVLALCDKYGKTRMMLSVDDKGQPMFNFYDKIEQRYGSLYIEESDGQPLLYLTDQEGRIIWEAQ